MQEICMKWKVVTSSSAAKPKFFWDKYFDFKRATVFCSGHCLSKHKMTRYVRNVWKGMVSLATPGYACAYTNRMKRKEQ